MNKIGDITLDYIGNRFILCIANWQFTPDGKRFSVCSYRTYKKREYNKAIDLINSMPEYDALILVDKTGGRI